MAKGKTSKVRHYPNSRSGSYTIVIFNFAIRNQFAETRVYGSASAARGASTAPQAITVGYL